MRRLAGAAGSYVRRHHVGLLALFVALGGTAYAVTAPKNSVTSKSIRANAVRSPDIKANAVKGGEIAANAVDASKLDLAQEFEFTAEEITSNSTPSITHPVQVSVPESGFVQLYLTSEMRMVDDASTVTSSCLVTIDLPAAGTVNLPILGALAESATSLLATASSTATRSATSPSMRGAS